MDQAGHVLQLKTFSVSLQLPPATTQTDSTVLGLSVCADTSHQRDGFYQTLSPAADAEGQGEMRGKQQDKVRDEA